MQGSELQAGRGESQIRRRMAQLISESLIDVVFQPIVDIQNAHIAGFEALTRPRPESGFEDAGTLFDTAEQSGLLWPLEEVTRSAAFEAAADWRPDVLLFMNCSPPVFADERFADEVQASVLRTHGLTPGRVILEITERSEQQHIEGLSRQVAQLKQRGFQVAIDDVGAGTSGLNRIMRLRPHWLKLDRDLVDSIDRDRVKQNLIRFLVHFARLSGVKVIAEGVERTEELAMLMDLGIVYAQGFYLGRPGSRDQALSANVVRWLRRRCMSVQSRRQSGPVGQRVGRLTRPARIVSASSSVADVAADLRADESLSGVVVVEGERCLGWADRDRVLERSRSEQAGFPVAAIVPSGSLVASPEDGVNDIVDQLGSRDGRNASHPLIIVEAKRVLGIVTVGDVLSTVAEMTRDPLLRATPITGMPGRVRADEYLATLISQATTSPPGHAHDAAVIDIRHFADYNGAFGYELGDQLLQELCNAIRVELMRANQDVFVAHLNDDRFFIAAGAGTLEHRIPSLIERFELAAKDLSASPASPTADRTLNRDSGVGLRVILIPNAVSRIADPRELFRLAALIRDRASNGGQIVQPMGAFSEVLRERPHRIAIRGAA